jgi:hypothetical protein
MSERKSGQILKFFSINGNYLEVGETENKTELNFQRDRIKGQISVKYLAEVEASVSIKDNFIKIKRGKGDKTLQNKTE